MVGERVSPVSMLSNHLILTSASLSLSAVLTARLILNMHKVADTDGMAVGDVASEDVDTVVPLWIGSTRRTRVGMRHEDSVRSAAQGAHGLQ